MRLYSQDRLAQPPSEEWQEEPFGFSLGEMRFVSYLGIAACLSLNIVGVLYLADRFTWDFLWLVENFGAVCLVAAMAFLLLLYSAVHELVHMLFFPGHGRSESTLVGLYPWALFVVHNGPIPVPQFKRSIRAPLVFLTPPCVLAVVLFPGSISVNLLVLHLFSSIGDVILYRKVSGLKGVTDIWSGVVRVWFRRGVLASP